MPVGPVVAVMVVIAVVAVAPTVVPVAPGVVASPTTLDEGPPVATVASELPRLVLSRVIPLPVMSWRIGPGTRPGAVLPFS